MIRDTVIRWYDDNVVERVDQGCLKANIALGKRVEVIAKRLLSEGGGSGGEPSPPGEPPHVQTGALRSSVGFAVHGKTVIIGPTEKYGKVHEFGGRHHPKRPFMKPALREALGWVEAEYRKVNFAGMNSLQNDPRAGIFRRGMER